MRILHALAVTVALAVPSLAQQFDHHRIEQLADSGATAAELEVAGYTVVEGSLEAGSLEIHATAGEVAALEAQVQFPTADQPTLGSVPSPPVVVVAAARPTP